MLVLTPWASSQDMESIRIPAWTHNHLLDATISSNIESYDKGLRGEPRDMIYDFENGKFEQKSSWSEYGIDAEQSLGIIQESSPVFWMASWEKPISFNYIQLSGCYPNQPQPNTAWKIDVRNDGQWREHARGIGGWYDSGRYMWRAPENTQQTIDAIRVSLFSNPESPSNLDNIHFRGEKKVSWVVAKLPEIDVDVHLSKRIIRLNETLEVNAVPTRGKVNSWRWDFGDGTVVKGKKATHQYTQPGSYTVRIEFANKRETTHLDMDILVQPPIEARITPVDTLVRTGDSVPLSAGDSLGKITRAHWTFEDGSQATGSDIKHTFTRAEKHTIQLTVSDGNYTHTGTAIIWVHESKASIIPTVLLDTDQKNEQDDQHFLGYAVFSELHLLGVNSVHHGGGQEQINYDEIVKVLDLSKRSGAQPHRLPDVYRGADDRLVVPDSGKWFDTLPIITPAAEAILAVARGASLENPAWIVPVGPGTNVASAILMAREQGLDLRGRIRIMWLGGSNKYAIQEFNGNNDPWSLYVIGQGDVETWIMPAPVGARVKLDVRTEADWYADNPLGEYLKSIMPKRNKPLYDPAVLSAIIDMHSPQGWVKETEYVTIDGPDDKYQWVHSDTPTDVILIREVDQQAMKEDIFSSMKGEPRSLNK